MPTLLRRRWLADENLFFFKAALLIRLHLPPRRPWRRNGSGDVCKVRFTSLFSIL